MNQACAIAPNEHVARSNDIFCFSLTSPAANVCWATPLRPKSAPKASPPSSKRNEGFQLSWRHRLTKPSWRRIFST